MLSGGCASSELNNSPVSGRITADEIIPGGFNGSSDSSAAGGSADSSAGGENTSADTKNIKISWWGGDSRHEATQNAVNAFMEKYPDIHVEMQYGEWSGWEDAMSASFFAGTAPDVNQINWNWIESYSFDGSMFLDMNSVSDVFDLSQYSQSALDSCTVAGKLQAIPVSMTGRIFYWNKTTFDKAGISVPTSLVDLYSAGRIFRQKLGEDYYPLVCTEYDRMILLVYYLESKYNKTWVENKKLNYSAAEIKEGLEFLKSLEDGHVIPTVAVLQADEAASIDKNPRWQNGSYAGIFEWDSSASKFGNAMEEGNELVVGNYFPDMGPAKGGFSKVSLAFAITEKSPYPKESAQLLNYLLNEEDGASLMASERGIPLSASALKVCTERELLNPQVAEANRKVLDWVSFGLDAKFEDSRLKAAPDGIYIDAISGYSLGKYTSDEAAKILYDGITAVLNG